MLRRTIAETVAIKGVWQRAGVFACSLGPQVYTMIGNYSEGFYIGNRVKNTSVQKLNVLTNTCLGVTVSVRDGVVYDVAMTTPEQVFVFVERGPSLG